MFKQLQRKMILAGMTSLLLVLLVMVMAINGINVYRNNREADEMLALLTNTNGNLDIFLSQNENMRDNGEPFGGRGPQITAETQFETRFFITQVTEAESLIGIDLIDDQHIAAVTENDIIELTESVYLKGLNQGYADQYRYLRTDNGDGTVTLAFMDCRRQLDSIRTVFIISIGAAIFCLAGVFILMLLLSKRAVRPFIDNYERQKQFVLDAGHELKTPLAIISANADVLELTSGQNEWLDSIHNQTRRMGGLIRHLLDLAKMEGSNMKLTFAEFSISEAVEETAAQFAALAETQNKNYTVDVQPELLYNGNRNSICQLVSLLLDNALKYSQEGGDVKLKLYKKNKNIVLEVFNTSDCIDKDSFEHLFDRFYRADSSRSRETGGYGIGLSVAKAIAEAHKGNIEVSSESADTILFTVML